jgi:hypothetical protein
MLRLFQYCQTQYSSAYLKRRKKEKRKREKLEKINKKSKELGRPKKQV